MSQKRLLSGIQPTGKVHLGNYIGAIQNWVELQDSYETFLMIADLHALTSTYEQTESLSSIKLELAIDLLASGIDPEKCSLFIQSEIPEHSELHLIFSMITPLGWLERVPTYKSKIQEIKGKDLNTYGFLGYPLLQATDILLYKADIVPVGEDQLPHLELTREIGRRFNHLYSNCFPDPQHKLTKTSLLIGLDGRKMSKSYQNTIPLSESSEQTEKKLLKMISDSNRVRRDDPGNPDICSVFSYHKLFTSIEKQKEIHKDCQTAKLGCFDCKKMCADSLNKKLQPIREKRESLRKNTNLVKDILNEGTHKARKIAKNTLGEIKEKVKL